MNNVNEDSKTHPLYQKLRLEKTTTSLFDFFFDKKLRVTRIAKVLSTILLILGSFSLANVFTVSEVWLKIVCFSLCVPCLLAAAILVDPESRYMDNKNKLWGLPKSLRKAVDRQMFMQASITKELRWCTEAFNSISEKNRDYSYYSKSYDVIRQAADNTVKSVYALSFGLITWGDTLLNQDIEYSCSTTNDKLYISWKDDVARLRSVVEDLEKIWARYLDIAKIPTQYMIKRKYLDRLWEYGEEIGVKSAIDAYMSGVPADDIAI